MPRCPTPTRDSANPGRLVRPERIVGVIVRENLVRSGQHRGRARLRGTRKEVLRRKNTGGATQTINSMKPYGQVFHGGPLRSRKPTKPVSPAHCPYSWISLRGVRIGALRDIGRGSKPLLAATVDLIRRSRAQFSRDVRAVQLAGCNQTLRPTVRLKMNGLVLAGAKAAEATERRDASTGDLCHSTFKKGGG